VKRPRFEADVLPVSPEVVDATHRPTGIRYYNTSASGLHMRVAYATVMPGVAIQVAYPLTETDTVLHRLREIFFVVTLIGIGAAALLGWMIARSTLRPVTRLTEASEQIGLTGDLARRIAVTGDDELSRLAGSFNQMMERLERSVGAQRQLVADASHELRTPLTSLRTNFEVLQRGALAESDRPRLMGAMEEQLAEVVRLVEDLVELARDELPADQAEDIRLDLLVADAVGRAQRDAPSTQFQMSARPVLVHGAPDKVARAVGNLLGNAAKWSPPGGVVEVAVADGSVVVRDHGPGIAEADLPHVFERFYRSADARGKPGSGLGLAIVRQVAESHGGSTTVRNAPGGGSEFRLSLPQAPDDPEPAPAPLSHPSPATS
jgi:two-component system sensor histidine kinase MprB